METRPLQSSCGWAFSWLGRPCVAQRVCPRPTVGLGTIGAGGREERVEVADGAHGAAGPPSSIEHDARRVVAAVLEPSQTVEDDRLAGTAPGVAYDAAHPCSLLGAGRRGAGSGRHAASRVVPPSPAGFGDSLSTVPGREASAESFDEPPPRHPRARPLRGFARGPGARSLTGVRAAGLLCALILPPRQLAEPGRRGAHSQLRPLAGGASPRDRRRLVVAPIGHGHRGQEPRQVEPLLV